MPASLIVYGIVANILMFAPWFVWYNVEYATAKYHDSMVQQLVTTYAPLGWTWVLWLLNDSTFSREMLVLGLETAAVGPLANLWVAYYTYMMAAEDAGAIGLSGNDQITYFIIGYPVFILFLFIFHWFAAPPIFAYLQNLPLPLTAAQQAQLAADNPNDIGSDNSLSGAKTTGGQNRKAGNPKDWINEWN